MCVTQVQEVEDIPQDVEQGWDRAEDRVEQGFDNTVQGIEDIPEDVAGGIGEGVGDVERFGDNVDNAFDRGRTEGRDDDGW